MRHGHARPKLLAAKCSLSVKSLLQVSKRLGIQDYTNREYEREVNEPTLMIVLAYARLLEIPVEYLIDYYATANNFLRIP